MRVQTVNQYGPKADFVAADWPVPAVKPGHVLIEVKATSLNPVDHKLLTADTGLNPTLPAVLHMDVAGIVAEVGEGVQGFAKGDPVYGCAGGLQGQAGRLDGALADFMLADARLLAHKPLSLDFGQAAALPLVTITAWEGLFDRAHLKAGQKVLVHGGAGGVGHIAVQLAKAAGAHVSTTVSGQHKADIARQLGADEVIYYKEESVNDYVKRLTGEEGFDLVYDTLGGENLDRSLQAARISGQVVGIIGRGSHDLTPMHSKGLSLHLVFMLLPMITGQGRARHGDILRQMAALVDEGKVRPLLHPQRFGFAQANEAHQLYAANRHVGKIVLENIDE